MEKSKRHKKCVLKEKLKVKGLKNCIKATQLENKINQIEKIKLT